MLRIAKTSHAPADATTVLITAGLSQRVGRNMIRSADQVELFLDRQRPKRDDAVPAAALEEGIGCEYVQPSVLAHA
jgi:hypothetical protein